MRYLAEVYLGRVYWAIDGDFMPVVLGWDDGERPLLLLEDLSDCGWPPLWDDRRVEQVLDALARLHAVDDRGSLTPLGLEDPGYPDPGGAWPPSRRRFRRWGWRRSVGCAQAHQCLAAAAEGVALDGPCPTHLHVRSDNICFRDGCALLVD